MTRTLYYLNCQVLNESFLQNLLPTVLFCFVLFFFAIKPYFARAQFIRFYHVCGRTFNSGAVHVTKFSQIR